jgi:hypothetical protein
MTRRLWAITRRCAIVSAPLLFACGASRSGLDTTADATSPAPDSSAPDAGAPVDVTDAGPPLDVTDAAAPEDAGPSCDVVCNAIANGARVVTAYEFGGTVPGFSGGPITDGTYYLTFVGSYGAGAGGMKYRATWAFSGGTLQVAQDTDCDLGPTGTATYATDGGELDLNFTCPPAKDTMPGRYVANGNDFTYSPDLGPTGIVFSFTKQ